jgi:hypothetical protein
MRPFHEHAATNIRADISGYFACCGTCLNYLRMKVLIRDPANKFPNAPHPLNELLFFLTGHVFGSCLQRYIYGFEAPCLAKRDILGRLVRLAVSIKLDGGVVIILDDDNKPSGVWVPGQDDAAHDSLGCDALMLKSFLQIQDQHVDLAAIKHRDHAMLRRIDCDAIPIRRVIETKNPASVVKRIASVQDKGFRAHVPLLKGSVQGAIDPHQVVKCGLLLRGPVPVFE